MISSSNSLSRGSGMLHQVDDAFTARHVRYRAVPRTNRTPAKSSRAYQSKSARVERAGIVMQSSGLDGGNENHNSSTTRGAVLASGSRNGTSLEALGGCEESGATRTLLACGS